MPRLRPLILAACVLALAMCAPASAAQKGVVPYMTWGTPSAADVSAEGAAIAGAHVAWARLNVQWRQVETSRGVYDATRLAVVDRAVDAVRAAGATPLLMVYNAPAWASSTTGSDQGNVPRDPADYASFVRFLATRYRGVVGAYEIWNEPDLGTFWAPGPNPAAYTALLRAAYPAIKAADPAARVVFGGLSYNNADGYAFPAAAYAAGAKGFFDAMGVHTYGACNETPEHTQSYADGSIMEGSFLRYRNVRRTMLAQGDDKPIWITEFGWSTTTTVACNPGAGVYYAGVGEATQADYLTRSFKVLEQDPYVEVAIWYTLRNDWMDDNTVNGRYGLIRWDFSHKPAFDALAAYTPPAGATASPPPPGSAPASADEPPVVDLTAPTSGATFSTSLALRADAADDRGVAKVEFWVDSRRVATDTTAPYAATYKPAKKAGYTAHQIVARAYDTAGQVTSSATVTATRTRTTSTTLAVRASGATAARAGRRPSLRRGGVARGRVRGARAGVVVLRAERRARGRWVAMVSRRAHVRRDGRYSARLRRGMKRGHWRVRAAFRGGAGHAPSTSAPAYFRV